MHEAFVPSTGSHPFYIRSQQLTWMIADKREFIKISQAVGMGFIVMGVIGYVVKLSTYRPSL